MVFYNRSPDLLLGIHYLREKWLVIKEISIQPKLLKQTITLTLDKSLLFCESTAADAFSAFLASTFPFPYFGGLVLVGRWPGPGGDEGGYAVHVDCLKVPSRLRFARLSHRFHTFRASSAASHSLSGCYGNANLASHWATRKSCEWTNFEAKKIAHLSMDIYPSFLEKTKTTSACLHW